MNEATKIALWNNWTKGFAQDVTGLFDPGDTLSILTGVAHGVAVLVAGILTYTPNPLYSGMDEQG